MKKPLDILLFTILYLIGFTIFAFMQSNIEFLFYVSVVVIVFGLLYHFYESLKLSKTVLWGLSLWGLLHMMGGNIPVDGSVLYNLQLIPVVLKYDQFVHLFGFGAATLLCYELLAPMLTAKLKKGRLAFLIVMMGLGVGALNEIIEFIAVLSIPETNVGGYENTAWDLVFDLFGALLALIFIFKYRLTKGRG